MDKIDFYQPILGDLGWIKPPANFFNYYEIRVWKKHEIIESIQFNTLKQAKNYYKTKWKELEEKNLCYVEIIRIKNLKTYHKASRVRVQPTGTK